MSSATFQYDRWPNVISIYPDSTDNNPTILVNATHIIVSNDDEMYDCTFPNKTITEIVSELNGNLTQFTVKQNLDIGAEQVLANTLFSESITEDNRPDNPFTIRYKGLISRATERSVIQLKQPRALSQLEPWYPRIGNGKFRARFNDISFQGINGINRNATYEFSIPEFIKQEWSPIYGPPFKTVEGELPRLLPFNSNLGLAVLKVANTPIYYKNNNISILINGIRQSNNIIKYVDQANGLIYLSQRITGRFRLTVDYTFREYDYVYDAIDLNASISNNPFIIDTYVAFFLKPSKSDYGPISGGNAIYHEILNTQAAAQTTTVRLIPETANTSNPMYEPVIYLGSFNTRDRTQYTDFTIRDTRSRGGGVYEKYQSNFRESDLYLDIGSVNGIDIPGNAGVVITVPDQSNLGMSKEETEARAIRDISLGVIPIVEIKND